MGLLSRIRSAASTARALATDARQAARDLGAVAAEVARDAAREAARDLADRAAKAGPRVAERAAPTIERAAAAVQDLAPRAARELRAVAKAARPAPPPPPPRPAPAPKQAKSAKPEPAPEKAPPPQKPSKASKHRKGSAARSIVEANERRKAAQGAGKVVGKKPAQGQSLLRRNGWVRFGPDRNAYITREDLAMVNAIGAQAELVAWLGRHAQPGMTTLNAYQIAGSARWAEIWQPVVLGYDRAKREWDVAGQAVTGTADEANANGRALAERYRVAGRAPRHPLNRFSAFVTIWLPARVGK